MIYTIFSKLWRSNGCHSGYGPIGLYSTECMGHGEWVPDPQEFETNCLN
jgi:hypothetical protein